MSENKPTAPKAESAADKRKATVAKKREERIKARGYALPLVLKCNETGDEVKYTSPAYIDKCIAKAGSLEKLKKTYVSRKGRRIIAARTPKAVKAPKIAKPAKAPKAAPKAKPAKTATPAPAAPASVAPATAPVTA